MNTDFSDAISPVSLLRQQNGSQMFRKPVRVTITVNHATYTELEHRSTQQGRSISNLAAFLLEASLQGPSR
jgi:hypothetical protein